MAKKVFKFPWDDNAGEAKFSRGADGKVHYHCAGRLVFTIDGKRWDEMVAALARYPIPSETLPIVGEIVGWRCWRWHNGNLWSLHREFMWEPHDVIQGYVGEDQGGIYAFKNKSRAMTEAISDSRNSPIVVGSVMLWGDAIEAQNGWRAEYAKIVSLDRLYTSEAAEKRFGRRITPPPQEVTAASFFGLRRKTISIPCAPYYEPLDKDAMLARLRERYLDVVPDNMNEKAPDREGEK